MVSILVPNNRRSKKDSIDHKIAINTRFSRLISRKQETRDYTAQLAQISSDKPINDGSWPDDFRPHAERIQIFMFKCNSFDFNLKLDRFIAEVSKTQQLSKLLQFRQSRYTQTNASSFLQSFQLVFINFHFQNGNFGALCATFVMKIFFVCFSKTFNNAREATTIMRLYKKCFH